MPPEEMQRGPGQVASTASPGTQPLFRRRSLKDRLALGRCGHQIRDAAESQEKSRHNRIGDGYGRCDAKALRSDADGLAMHEPEVGQHRARERECRRGPELALANEDTYRAENQPGQYGAPA